jgi:thiamine-monophosphate kinase
VLPRGIDESRAWRLAEGLRETAAAWGAPLVGGDIATMPATVEHAPIIASVTILAVPLAPDARIATRADARVGDGVYVTGAIGGAWDRATGLGRHLDFTPRIAAAHALAAALGERLGAMIDVSDGLGRDLGHIAAQSKVAIELDLASVPVAHGIAPRDAIGHGEDYELAFTARGEVPHEAAGVAVTRIGTVVAGDAQVRAHDGAAWFDAGRLGFEHDGGLRAEGGAR